MNRFLYFISDIILLLSLFLKTVLQRNRIISNSKNGLSGAFKTKVHGTRAFRNIENLISFANCNVNIYNRYREKVYSSIGYGIPQAGKYGVANLSSGTYYYIMNQQYELKVLSESVTIIR